MHLKAKVVSDRKRPRKFTKRRLESYIERQLVLHTRQVARSSVNRRMQTLLTQEKRSLQMKSRPTRGEIEFIVKFPGFEDAAGQKVRVEGSWLDGEKVVFEVSDGFFYKFGGLLERAMGEDFNAEPAENAENKRLRNTSNKLQRRLHAAVRGTVYNEQPFKKKVRHVLDKVTKDLSLAKV